MRRTLPFDEEKLPIFMAPMAGYTDLSYRKILFSCGLSYAVTEMVSAKALSYDDEKTISISKTDKSTGIQLFGHEEEAFEIAIKKHLNPRDDFLWIDLNFGCPAPKITKNKDGSYLLNDLKKLQSIIKTCKKVSNKKVSAKIRLGYNDKKNYLEIAKAVEDAGSDFLTVHGRTRDMYYSGEADWEKIFEIREKLKIPVIGNGDIKDSKRAIYLLENELVDGVAIGRAAIGNPFIFTKIKNHFSEENIKEENIKEVAKKHYLLMIEEKGEKRATNDFKKHLIKYVRNERNANKIRQELSALQNKEDIIKILDKIFDKD